MNHIVLLLQQRSRKGPEIEDDVNMFTDLKMGLFLLA